MSDYDPLADEIRARSMQRDRQQPIPKQLRKPAMMPVDQPITKACGATPECACRRSIADDLMAAAAKVRTVLSKAARSRTTNK